MLAKALAHYFEAKLLLLDVNDFSLKVQSKYGASSKENVSILSVSLVSYLMVRWFSFLSYSVSYK